MDYLGEKRVPNQWILFVQKVDGALKTASIITGAATVTKQFASSLKDIKPYDDWTDEAIVEAWSTWGDKPEQSKSSKAKAEAEAAEAAGDTQGAAAAWGVAAAAAAEESSPSGLRMRKGANSHSLHIRAQKAKNRAGLAAEQKAVRILNARESERAANLIFPRQNQTRRKPTWGIPNVGPGFGGSRKRKSLRKHRRSRK